MIIAGGRGSESRCSDKLDSKEDDYRSLENKLEQDDGTDRQIGGYYQGRQSDQQGVQYGQDAISNKEGYSSQLQDRWREIVRGP